MESAPITSPGVPLPAQETAGIPREELDAARVRRASLRRAAAGVRDATGPAELSAAADELRQVWTAHTEDTESPDGMLAQIVQDCPRLSPAVERARAEHGRIAAALDAVRSRLEPGVELSDGVRSAVEAVLGAVDRHRLDGRQLIYDAYAVDLGLGG